VCERASGDRRPGKKYFFVPVEPAKLDLLVSLWYKKDNKKTNKKRKGVQTNGRKTRQNTLPSSHSGPVVCVSELRATAGQISRSF